MANNILELRKFVAPEFVFGAGARKLAGQYAKNMGVHKVLLVTDPGVIEAGWVKGVCKSLEKEGIKYKIYSNVTPNPRSTEVMEGVEVYQQENCNAILAVGGGSPMDCAKGIGIVVANNKHILEFEGIDKVIKPVPPMIFVPTTAGTAAEVSQFAIILNKKELVKIAIVSKTIIPDIALIDSETTSTMDTYLTACTGMDALVHAVEAFVSNSSSPITDVHALEAIRMVNTYLPAVMKEPENQEYRARVMLGSLEAGLAFSNAILGAVHAMAHSLGGFLDLPHGECNSLLLEHVVNFNYSKVPEKFDLISKTMGLDLKGLNKKERQNKLINHIINMKKQVGITKSLNQVGVKRVDIKELSVKAIKDVCMITNPRDAILRDIEVVYEEAL